MASFIQKPVDTIDDYNLYCHYVAGLVGIGLSHLFIESGLEKDKSILDEKLSNSMGLFLQKTNIIRDFHEDIIEDRVFWPSSVWKKYTDKLENFKDLKNIDNAVKCLNELITEAFTHVPDVLEYLSRLKNQQMYEKYSHLIYIN